MKDIKIYTFGKPRIVAEDSLISLHRRKSLALLIYLSINKKSYSREFLSTLLWPEYDRYHGLASLRQCILELQNELGREVFNLTGETVALSTQSSLWIDVEELQETVSQCRSHIKTAGIGFSNRAGLPEQLARQCQSTVQLYNGDFLEGFSLADSADFDDWQLNKTESLRQDYIYVLKLIVYDLEIKKAFPEACAYSQEIIHADPLNEEAHRLLMRNLYYNGERHSALQQYFQCVHLLKKELGVEPEEETTQLYNSLRQPKQEEDNQFLNDKSLYRKPPKKTSKLLNKNWKFFLIASIVIVGLLFSGFQLFLFLQHESTTLEEETSIAILPFTGIGSDDHTADWTSRGLTELLTNKLTKDSPSKVISRNTGYTYGNPPSNPRVIVKELNIRFLVEGAVLNTHDRIEVVVRLIDLKTNRYIWQSQYSPKSEDILQFLDQTTSEISTSILEYIEMKNSKAQTRSGR